jgi:hypothetical protein
MVTISGTTYIKTIFSFWSYIGKNFVGNALYSSDDSVRHLIQILHFFAINIVFNKLPEENIKRSQIWRKTGPENGHSSSYPNDPEIASPETEKWNRAASDWKTIPTGT